jgi:hypothetical protein
MGLSVSIPVKIAIRMHSRVSLEAELAPMHTSETNIHR